MRFFRYLLFICIIFQYTSYSQSSDFITIKEDTTISKSQKEILFDSLLDTHKVKSDYKLFLDDSYSLMSWYYSNKNVEKAITYNKRNISLMDSIHYQDSIVYRKNIYSLGFYQSRNKKFDDAILTYSKLINYEIPDKFAILATYQLGEIHFGKHQYHIAIRYYNLSKEISKSLNNNNYKVLNAIGIAQSNKLLNTKKSLANGISILSSTITLTDSLNNDSDPKNNISLNHVYNLYNQLGNLYSDRDDHNFEKAKFNLEKALKIATQLNKKKHLVSSYNDIGYLYIKEKDSAAETYLKKALGFRSNELTISTIYRNLARHHLEFDEFDVALENAQKSIRILLDFDASNYNNLPSKEQLHKSKYKLFALEGIIQKSKIWIKLGENDSINSEKYFNKALKTLKLADSILVFARLESQENRSKLFWQRVANSIYINATKCSFLLNKPEDAFYFIEKNKALLLLEDVTLRLLKTESKIPETINKKEIKLKNRIQEIKEIALLNNTDSIQSKLLIAINNYGNFIDSLDTEYKLYYKLKTPTNVIAFEAFKSEFINNDNAFIEYILDDDEGYGIIITSKNVTLFELRDVKKLKDLALNYRKLLGQPLTDKVSMKNYNEISNEIYRIVIPNEITPILEEKKLTIIPDYYLQNIPFESLMTSEKDDSYFIFQNEINYAYSLSFLKENNKIKRVNTNNIIALAPIHFPSGLASLPNTKAEIEHIDSVYSTSRFFNKNATKKTFFEESNNHKIIHLATHANANDSISPWISFYDSKVSLEELYNLKNSAELVVLSACNTSLGEIHKGEGVMSLSRGFFNTGSHSVMPTLWDVNDKSSTELISSFYENIKLGQDKSLALHNAKLDYIKTNSLSQSSPYYWASFILIGDSGKLELNNKFPVIYYVVFGVILMIILLLLFRRKNKNFFG